MKIDKRNAIFGEELGNIIASGSLTNKEIAPEVSEKDFASNIYKIESLEDRNTLLCRYIQKLSEHASPQAKQHSTCKRLIKRLEEEAQKHQDGSQKVVEKAVNGLFFSRVSIERPKSSLENIEELSKAVLSGKALISEKKTNWLKEQERCISCLKEDASNETELNNLLQTVKKYSKKIAAKSELPYKRIPTNLAVFPEQNYIMTACPKTAEEQKQFWDMANRYKSTTIVAVLIPNEKGIDHELEYCNPKNLPTDLEGGWVHNRTTKEVIAKSAQEELKDCKLVKRTFYLANTETSEEKTITHFHYEGWPNKKAAPDQALFNRLVEAVDEVHQNKESPIIVHCAAGRGRSGAFVAAHVTKRQIDAAGQTPVKLNIAATLMHGRLQRDGFVESKGQMKTIYDAALDFTKSR